MRGQSIAHAQYWDKLWYFAAGCPVEGDEVGVTLPHQWRDEAKLLRRSVHQDRLFD